LAAANGGGGLSGGNVEMRSHTLKALLLAASLSGVGSWAAAQGIPTFDSSNLMQNIESAVQSVAQTEKQIQQYQLQLQQYQNMLQNSLAPAAYIWDQAQQTMAQLQSATNTLQQYKQQLGSIDAFLNNFGTTAQYATSPCFSQAGCSADQLAQLQQQDATGLAAQKAVADASLKGLDQQQQNVAADAQRLTQLQSQAQNATGQMEALAAANQLASEQANQLLQMRQLLITQGTAASIALEQQTAAQAKAKAAASAVPDSYTFTGPYGNSDPLAEALKVGQPTQASGQ
jgi:type IV secretion system protein TrbJ